MQLTKDELHTLQKLGSKHVEYLKSGQRCADQIADLFGLTLDSPNKTWLRFDDDCAVVDEMISNGFIKIRALTKRQKEIIAHYFRMSHWAEETISVWSLGDGRKAGTLSGHVTRTTNTLQKKLTKLEIL